MLSNSYLSGSGVCIEKNKPSIETCIKILENSLFLKLWWHSRHESHESWPSNTSIFPKKLHSKAIISLFEIWRAQKERGCFNLGNLLSTQFVTQTEARPLLLCPPYFKKAYVNYRGLYPSIIVRGSSCKHWFTHINVFFFLWGVCVWGVCGCVCVCVLFVILCLSCYLSHNIKFTSFPVHKLALGLGVVNNLKAYSLMSNRGRSQHFQNLNFLHIFIALL